MTRLLFRLFGLALSLVPAGAIAQSSGWRFPDATEAVPELIELWQASNALCRSANGGDVKVAAACLSRSVYGLANERNWCLGTKAQANAQMTWHECRGDSLRFPAFTVPAY